MPQDDCTSEGREVNFDAARWQTIVDVSPDAIITIDQDGQILFFNSAAERIFGYLASEVLGQNVNVLMPAPYRDEHDQYIHNYHRTGVPKAIGRIRHVRAQRKNGETFPIELSVSFTQMGDNHSYTAIIRDVSQRSQMEAALQEQEKRIFNLKKLAALGEFSAKIAHEVNNPLTIIINKIRLLLMRQESLSPKVCQELEKVIDQSERIAGLMRSLLEYGRPSTLPKKPININQPILQTLSLVEEKAQQHNVQIQHELTEAPPPVHASSQQLQQVFLNLFFNAIDAMSTTGGTLHISSRLNQAPHPTKISVDIKDTGPGIAPELQEKLFLPFFTTKHKTGGSGLGLAICQSLIVEHEGFLSVTSTPGQGACFRVTLPITDADLRGS